MVLINKVSIIINATAQPDKSALRMFIHVPTPSVNEEMTVLLVTFENAPSKENIILEIITAEKAGSMLYIIRMMPAMPVTFLM